MPLLRILTRVDWMRFHGRLNLGSPGYPDIRNPDDFLFPTIPASLEIGFVDSSGSIDTIGLPFGNRSVFFIRCYRNCVGDPMKLH